MSHDENRWGIEFGRFDRNIDEQVIDEIHEELNYIKMYDRSGVGKLSLYSVTWGVELDSTYCAKHIFNDKEAFIKKYRRGDGTSIRVMFLMWAMAKEYGVEHKVPCLAMVCEGMCCLDGRKLDESFINKGPWERIDLVKAGWTLRAIRTLGGLTTDDIGKYIGATRSVVNNVENGNVKHSGIVRYAMCIGAPFLLKYNSLAGDDMDDLRRYVYRVLHPAEWLELRR